MAGEQAMWFLHAIFYRNYTIGNFLWVSRTGDSQKYDSVSVANCTRGPSHVRAKIECHGLDCRVTSMNKDDHPQGYDYNNYSDIYNWAGGLAVDANGDTWSLFWESLALATIQPAGSTELTSSATEHYIYGEEASPFEEGQGEELLDTT